MTLNPDTLAAIEALPAGICDLTGSKHTDLVERRVVLALLRSEAGGEPDWCYRYWGSDGTLCAKHHGRFASPSENRCDRAALSPSPEATPTPLSTREFAYQQATGHASPERVAELRRRGGAGS